EAGRAWEEVAAGLDGAVEPQRLAEVKRQLATVYELEGVTPRAAAARLEAASCFEAAGLDADAAGEGLPGAHAVGGATPSAERALDQAVQAARRAERSDLESRCLTSQGFLAGRAGRREEGLELIRSALSLALGESHVEAALYAYWALGATANDWGDYAEARSAFDEAVVYCQANGLGEEEHLCLGCLVVVLGNSGDWTRAEELGRDVLDRTPLPDVSRVHALMTLGLISTARGSTKRARRLLGRAHALATEFRLENSEHECVFSLALVDELEGTESSRWHEFVAHPIAQAAAARPRGLRLASTFAARRGDTELVYACAD